MPFTEDEWRAWHDEKRAREHRAQPVHRPPPAAICINCQSPFGLSAGVITDQVALCDICSGD
jgi:hypothetical protein